MIFLSKNEFKILLIFFYAILVSACNSSSNADLVEFVGSAYQDEQPEIDPLPPIEPYEEFIYSASELTDPFDASNVQNNDLVDDEKSGLNSNRRKEPLEAFPLDGLRLEGVLNFKGKLSAIIRAPTGDSVAVSAGNYLGLNSGKILSIDSERQIVEIEEVVRNAIGNLTTRIVKMTSNADDSAK